MSPVPFDSTTRPRSVARRKKISSENEPVVVHVGRLFYESNGVIIAVTAVQTEAASGVVYTCDSQKRRSSTSGGKTITCSTGF